MVFTIHVMCLFKQINSIYFLAYGFIRNIPAPVETVRFKRNQPFLRELAIR